MSLNSIPESGRDKPSDMESNGQGEQSRDNLEDNTGSEFNTVTSKDKKRKHGTPKTR